MRFWFYLALLLSLFIGLPVYGQVHVTWWAQDNGVQHPIPQDSLWEYKISVPASRPTAYVWLTVQAEAPNQQFNFIRFSLDTGPFGKPGPMPWGWHTIWAYTSFGEQAWWYPRSWYSPADAVVIGRLPTQTLPARGDQVDMGLIAFQCPAEPGTYKVDMLGDEYPYAPTIIKLDGQNLTTRTQDLVIEVRPD